MISLVKDLLDAAKILADFGTGASTFTRNRRERLAVLLEQISETLSETSAKLRKRQVPFEACARLSEYADELGDHLKGVLPEKRAAVLVAKLHSSNSIRELAAKLLDSAQQHRKKAANLSGLDEAAGTFRAAAHLLRAK